MSWMPTLKLARAAWRGSKDPAGMIKAQFTEEPRPPAPAVTAAVPAAAPVPAPEPAGAPAPAPALMTAPVEAPVPEPVDDTPAKLLLLMR